MVAIRRIRNQGFESLFLLEMQCHIHVNININMDDYPWIWSDKASPADWLTASWQASNTVECNPSHRIRRVPSCEQGFLHPTHFIRSQAYKVTISDRLQTEWWRFFIDCTTTRALIKGLRSIRLAADGKACMDRHHYLSCNLQTYHRSGKVERLSQ